MQNLLVLCLTCQIIMSCEKTNQIETAKMDAVNPVDIPLVNIGNPVEEYTYDWGDTSIIAIEYHDGKRAGLTQWKNINVCSGDEKIKAIEFEVNNNKITKTDLSKTMTYFGSRPEVKIHDNNFYVIYIDPTIRRRVLKKFDIEAQQMIRQYQFEMSNTNIFAIDDDHCFYLSETPGLMFTQQDQSKNDTSDIIYSTPKGFPIGKYDRNLEPTGGIGRWICSGRVKNNTDFAKDIMLNQRNILFNDGYLYAMSFRYGYLEKYDTKGNFIDYLDINSKSEILNNKEFFITDMEIFNDNLFAITSISTKNFPAKPDLPEGEKYISIIMKINLSENEMKVDKFYYYPNIKKGYTGSFDMVDENTAVFARVGGLDVFELK